MLPTHKALRDLLTEATGRDVTIAPTAPYAPTPSEHPTFAVYVDQQMHTRAVAACDLELSVLLGTAMVRVPIGGAEAELAGRVLSSRTAEALRDLLTRLGDLLDSADGPVRLHGVYPPGVEPPSDIPAYAQALGRRIDLDVTVAAYGSGRLSVVSPAV